MLCDCQNNLSLLYIELTLSVLSERQITVELAITTINVKDGGVCVGLSVIENVCINGQGPSDLAGERRGWPS